jgi:hypothetical protein
MHGNCLLLIERYLSQQAKNRGPIYPSVHDSNLSNPLLSFLFDPVKFLENVTSPK